MQAPNALRIGTNGKPIVVFAHGWARTHRDFIPTAEALAPVADCLLLDLPGFGLSERPAEGWGTADYATYLDRHLAELLGGTAYGWVGHSFGGRIGLRLAAAGSAPLTHLVVVAGAGVPRERSPLARLKGRVNSLRFQAGKRAARTEEQLLALEERFGSADYVQSRALGLRDIFVRTVSEDQTDQLAKIACPTTLIYGSRDTETPPEIGRRIHALIPHSAYIECPEFGHISILDRGRHQIALAVKERLAV